MSATDTELWNCRPKFALLWSGGHWLHWFSDCGRQSAGALSLPWSVDNWCIVGTDVYVW